MDALSRLAWTRPGVGGWPLAVRSTTTRSANAAGYVAAFAAERVGGPEAAGAERRRQASWLIERLPALSESLH